MLNYRKTAAATLLIGIALIVLGFVMGGFNSVTSAGVAGGGIALTIHGGLASLGALLMSSPDD